MGTSAKRNQKGSTNGCSRYQMTAEATRLTWRGFLILIAVDTSTQKPPQDSVKPFARIGSCLCRKCVHWQKRTKTTFSLEAFSRAQSRIIEVSVTCRCHAQENYRACCLLQVRGLHLPAWNRNSVHSKWLSPRCWSLKTSARKAALSTIRTLTPNVQKHCM